MVKRSTKSKSKRTSIRKKHKIAHKVLAHNRKLRRSERLKARKRRAQNEKQTLKDPGVPASWPFREQFIKEMAFEKDRILAEKKFKQAQKKNKGTDKDEEMVLDDVEGLAEEAQKRDAEFELATEIQKEKTIAPDVGGREHYKDFRKVVSLADVVLQVLDARDPNGCRSSEVESFIHQFTPPKRLVFLLNKIDLVPRYVVESWLKYLRQFAPTIAFKCSTQKQTSSLGQSHNRTMESKSSVCSGADNLIQLLKNYTRHANIRTAITVGLVGVPNVGKSSVINSLKRSKATQVGNRPGVTTAIQEVHLDSQIRLLDSPGVIYEKRQGALQGVVCAEALKDPIAAVESICHEVASSTLRSVYGIEAFENATSFLHRIASKTGKLKKGGIPDTEAAARRIVQDWNNGKIPFHKMPPAQQTASDVQIVQNWAKEFSLEEVNDNVLDELIEELEQMPASLESAPVSTDVIPGAMEAFSRMAEVHKAKEQINEANRAMTDMHLSSPPAKAEHPPSTINPEEDLGVRIIQTKKSHQQRKGRRALAKETNVSRVKPKERNESRIRKKRARRSRKKMVTKITSSLAENLKL